MALDFSSIENGIAALRQDVQNVIAKLNEPNVDAQARIDAAGAALAELDAALDAVAPDPAPAPEPPAEEPPATEPTPEENHS